MNATIQRVTTLYKDKLLTAALSRLFKTHRTAKEVRKACGISIGAWYHFLDGKARNGVKLALVFTAAKSSIERDLMD